MREAAIVVTVFAAVVGMAAGLLTVIRRRSGWLRTSLSQFGPAVVALLVALTAMVQSATLALIATVIALFSLAFIVWSAHRNSSTI
jgi:hypothetical protein